MNHFLVKPLRQSLFGITILCSLSACQITTPNANKQFTQVAKSIVDYRQSTNPYSNLEGVEGYLLPNLSPKFLAQEYKNKASLLAELDAVNIAKLSDENQINFSIIRAQVQNSVDEYVFNAHYMPLTSEYGFHSGLSYIVNSSQYKNQQDYQVYLTRLTQVPRFFEQNIYWMKKGIETGLTQPKAVLEGYEDSINAYIVDDVTTSEFYKPFLTNTAGLSDGKFKALQQKAKNIIKDDVIQSYKNYLAFFTQQYRPSARTSIGISETPNGEAFYKNRAKYYTTTDMTPKEIHEL
ncbi:hypothetical protein LCGC14_3059180, partial [marine sediment metagenome]